EPLPFEDRVIRARELLVREPLRANLDAAELLQELRGQRAAPPLATWLAWSGRRARALDRRLRHGTSTTSNTRRTICSDVTSSASASYVRTTRWRSTSGPTAFTSSGVT